MKPVRLHFEATHAGWRQHLLGRDASPWGLAAIVVLLGALTACAALTLQAWTAQQKLADARDALAAVQRQAGRGSTVAAPGTPSMSPQQRQAWNQVTRQLNTPWTALLDALEASQPDDVALVSIEPDARQGTVRLQAEARSLDTLLAFARQLGTAPLFETVALVKHETNEQDGNRPVRLSLDIRLRALHSIASEAAQRPEGTR